MTQMCRTTFVVITFILVSFAKDFNQCKSVIALIPARGGSKSIKNKNLAKLGNETLLGRAIDTVKKSQVFQDFWVSTDDYNIAKEAENYGVKVHWRHANTATDTARTILAVKDFLMHHPSIRSIAVIQVTSPFLCPSYLKRAAKNFVSECVFSVTRVHSLRWSLSKDSFAKAINFNPKNRPRRQDWQGDLIENGMFYFTTRFLVTNGLLQSNRCKVVEIDKVRSLDIDNEFDLILSQSLIKLLPPC